MNVRQLIVLACIMSLAALYSRAHAQCARWLPGIGSVSMDGRVNAAVAWDPDGPGPEQEWLVIGGAFTQIGSLAVSRLAAFDGSRWRSIGSVDGEVLAMTVFQGELVIGGNFLVVGGVSTAGRVARYNGTRWAALATSLTPSDTFSTPFINAMTVSDGKLIVGGRFIQIGGIPALNVAQWDGQWTNMGTGLSSTVLELTTFGGQPIAISESSSILPRRWTGTAWENLGAGLTSFNTLSSIGTYNGELYLAGASLSFQASPSSTQYPLGRLSSDNVWRPMTTIPVQSFTTSAMLQFGDRLILAGNMSGVGPALAGGIVAWDGTTYQSLDGGFAVSQFSSTVVSGLAIWRGRLVAVGTFDRTAQGAVVSNVAVYDGASWRPFLPSVNDTVNFAVKYRDAIVLGGEFTSAGGIGANCVASWDGQSWRRLGNGLTLGTSSSSFPFARTAVLFGDHLVVGGSFLAAGDVIANNIARWDGERWQSMGRGFNGPVESLVVHQGVLYAAGSFSTSGTSNFGGRIARWDGNQWHPVGFLNLSSSFSQNFRVLVVHDNLLYYLSPEFWGTWNGNEWSNLFSSSSSIPSPITATVHNGRLYVGGSFSFVGSVGGFRNILVRNGSGWEGVGGGLSSSPSSASGAVRALVSHEGRLYAGGDFSLAGGLPAANIAALDGDSWSAVGPGTTSAVRALASIDSELVIGGDFSAAGQSASNFWARYTNTGTPAVIASRQDRTVELGSSLTLTARALPGYDNQGPLQYSWRLNDIPLIDTGTGPSARIFGSSTPTLNVLSTESADSGVYTCHITNACGTRIHQAGTIDVVFICRADLDNSGALESSDIFVFLNAWFTGSIQGDFDRDGDRDPADIFAFLNAYFAGC